MSSAPADTPPRDRETVVQRTPGSSHSAQPGIEFRDAFEQVERGAGKVSPGAAVLFIDFEMTR